MAWGIIKMIRLAIKHKYKLLLTTIVLGVLSFALANCYNSSSEVPPPQAIAPPPVGVAANGAIYYQNRCGVCHSAGRDDVTSAFGAVDLARRQDMIVGDISNFDQKSGFNMMGTFNNIPEQRVVDLKAYLESVPML